MGNECNKKLIIQSVILGAVGVLRGIIEQHDDWV